jgi:hypothetical protein
MTPLIEPVSAIFSKQDAIVLDRLERFFMLEATKRIIGKKGVEPLQKFWELQGEESWKALADELGSERGREVSRLEEKEKQTEALQLENGYKLVRALLKKLHEVASVELQSGK